jgi:hypothetical protein
MSLVMVDPAFSTTQMVMAAGWNGTDLVITTKYVGQQWGQTADDLEVDAGVIATALYNANLVLPSSFSSTVGTGEMRGFLGVNDIGGLGDGDVFLCVFGPAGADTSSATDLNVRGFNTSFQVTGLDMVGTFLLASGVDPTAPTVPMVYRSTDAASDGATFTAAVKDPSGAAGPIFFASSSLLITDAENGEAICGTFGANSGVYLTQNFGATWNGMSQLEAGIGMIYGLEFVGDVIYIVDDNGTIWRHDGQWLRLADPAYLLITPTCISADPDGNLFTFAEGTTDRISRSTDMGDTWTSQISPIPEDNLMEVIPLSSTNQIAINDDGEIFTTTNNGVLWFEREDGLAGNPVSYDTFGDNTEVLVGTDAGEVWWSGDSGMTWEDLDLDGSGNTYVVFGTKYGDDSFIYAADADGAYQTDATDPDWEAIDGYYTGASAPSGASTIEALVGEAAGIAAGTGGPQGMIYVTDAVDADTGDSDIMRFKCRETQSVEQTEFIEGPGGVMDGLWLTPGSNVLWVVVDGDELWTYEDVLGVFGSGVAVTYTTTSATITWDVLDEVDTYRVTLATTSIGGGTGGVHGSQDVAGAVTIETDDNTATFAGLTPATTYYVKVWGILPVSTFHFQGESSFATLPSAPVYTPNLMPPDGAYNVPTTVAFAWDPVSGATSYEWQLATDSGYTNIIATMSPTVPHLVYGPLDNSTSFFWRVRAVTDAGTSSWVSSVFSTEEAADPPVTVTQTSTTTTEVTEEITPMYIWVIIIIGAILTVAVIILIVRTRRVV